MKNLIYKLCSNCRLVHGISRSCIYDLQRQQYYPVPATIKALFNLAFEIDLDLIQKHFPDQEEQDIIGEYMQFLLQHELIIGLTRDEASLFPELDITWDFPAHISNCLIDANGAISWFDDHFMKQLETLCCPYLQLRFFRPVSLTYLESILSFIDRSTIKVTEFTLPESGYEGFHEEVRELVRSNGKIKAMIIHSAKESRLIDTGKLGLGTIISTCERINSSAHCGIVHPAYFTMNIPHFTESLHHNTCLNRKIGIDTEGNIKNCPSMPESFGNIKNTTLAEAIAKPGFKKYWNITKDQVNVCKDCEFRHICTDCRAYAEQPGDDYSKPLKCGYDPYTCTWEEWSTHPAKQKAIACYGLKDLNV